VGILHAETGRVKRPTNRCRPFATLASPGHRFCRRVSRKMMAGEMLPCLSASQCLNRGWWCGFAIRTNR